MNNTHNLLFISTLPLLRGMYILKEEIDLKMIIPFLILELASLPLFVLSGGASLTAFCVVKGKIQI